MEAIFASAEIDPAETLTESELDGIASLVSTPEGQKLLQTTVREQASNLGVVCLAERSDDLLMWAHYASAHTGVCIAFDTHAPPFSEAIDVQYSMTWPELAITGSHGDEAARKSLFTKPQAWSYENEWRLVENSFGLQPIDPNSVKGIIYGHRASESTVEALRKLCSTLKLPLQVATPSTGHYSLAITDAI